MTDQVTIAAAAIDPDDIGHNLSANPECNGIIAACLTRRCLFALGA